MSAEGPERPADVLQLSAGTLGEFEDNQSDRVDLCDREVADECRPTNQITSVGPVSDLSVDPAGTETMATAERAPLGTTNS